MQFDGFACVYVRLGFQKHKGTNRKHKKSQMLEPFGCGLLQKRLRENTVFELRVCVCVFIGNVMSL